MIGKVIICELLYLLNQVTVENKIRTHLSDTVENCLPGVTEGDTGPVRGLPPETGVGSDDVRVNCEKFYFKSHEKKEEGLLQRRKGRQSDVSN